MPEKPQPGTPQEERLEYEEQLLQEYEIAKERINQRRAKLTRAKQGPTAAAMLRELGFVVGPEDVLEEDPQIDQVYELLRTAFYQRVIDGEFESLAQLIELMSAQAEESDMNASEGSIYLIAASIWRQKDI